MLTKGCILLGQLLDIASGLLQVRQGTIHITLEGEQIKRHVGRTLEGRGFGATLATAHVGGAVAARFARGVDDSPTPGRALICAARRSWRPRRR